MPCISASQIGKPITGARSSRSHTPAHAPCAAAEGTSAAPLSDAAAATAATAAAAEGGAGGTRKRGCCSRTHV
eukprot:scaffold12703_cov48-Phaeocystis_antarctica.AAC.2